MDEIFQGDEYLIRRKLLTVLGASFQVFNGTGEQVLYSRQKAFKLKEDIRVYSDETMTEERLLIKARSIVDFGAAYDVVDVAESRKIGALRRRGIRSIMRDSWEFLDEADQPVVRLQEDSLMLALVRHFVINLLPQTFHISANGTRIATYKQLFNPIIQKLRIHITPEANEVLDPRVILAGAILIVAIEGRQRR